jgi:putative serine protease PepD
VGIGFAIPSSLVTSIAGQIIKHGRVINSHRAYLGVRLSIGLGPAIVTEVEHGGPAARAGLVPGDVIKRIAGHHVANAAELADVLAQLNPREEVSVTVVKPDGSEAKLKAVLGRYPGGRAKPARPRRAVSSRARSRTSADGPGCRRRR